MLVVTGPPRMELTTDGATFGTLKAVPNTDVMMLLRGFPLSQPGWPGPCDAAVVAGDWMVTALVSTDGVTTAGCPVTEGTRFVGLFKPDGLIGMVNSSPASVTRDRGLRSSPVEAGSL